MQTTQQLPGSALRATVELDRTLFRIRREFSPYRTAEEAFSSYLQNTLRQGGQCAPGAGGRAP